MVCPYAEWVKGTVAKCMLLNKKVSILRYPCKGNYRRCPVYIRRAPRREAEAQPAQPTETAEITVEKPIPPARVQRQQGPEKATVQEEKPVAPAVGRGEPRSVERPPVAEEKTGEAVKHVGEGHERRAGGVFKGSKVLCDSLVLASLTVSSHAETIYRGPLSGLKAELDKHVSSESIVFFVGDYGDYKLRILYNGHTMRFSLEKAGRTLCGEEAEKLIQELGSESIIDIDGVIYTVKLSDIPLWRDQILEELSS